jgi:hypothetical protein
VLSGGAILSWGIMWSLMEKLEGDWWALLLLLLLLQLLL